MDAKSAIQIGLAISVLGAFFVMYLSAKTWQWVQAVLVVCIFLATIFFWYLGAVVLEYHDTHRSEINRLKPLIAQTRAENEALRNGTTDKALLAQLEAAKVPIHRGGIRQAAHDLKKLLLGRGHMWTDVEVQKMDGSGAAQVAVAQPQPHGIPNGAILFAFERGPLNEGNNYLGEFKVAGVAEGSVTLQPAHKPDGRQLARITQSKGNWTLYEVMPVDRRDVFLSLSEQELAALLPPDSLVEYQRDNQPAKADDPEERVVGYTKTGVPATDPADVAEKRYARRLRDYAYIFRRAHAQAVIDANKEAQLTRDAALLKDAIAKAEKDIAYREAEKQKLQHDQQKFEHDLKVLQKHLATVERYRAAVAARRDALLAQTGQTAAELAKRQLQAAAAINRRTPAVGAQGATELQTSVGAIR